MNTPISPRSVNRTLASSIALLGALGMMSFSGVAQAGVALPQCSGTVGPVGEQTSEVKDLVTDDGNGTWTYQFRVCNTSNDQYGGGFLLRDWELPWDHTASNPIDTGSITVPDGWAWSIETKGVENDITGWDGEITWQDVGPDGIAGTADDDPFYDPRFASHPQVLHFYTACGEGFNDANFNTAVTTGPADCNFELPEAWIFPGESLAGFGFDASVGPTNAPYQASWIAVPPRSGDPAFPLVGGTALSSSFFSVPEPSSLLLLGASLGGIAGVAALRRRREDDEDEGSSNG